MHILVQKNQRDGVVVLSVCFAVDRPGVYLQSLVIPNDLKNGIHSFLASPSAHKEWQREQIGKLDCCALGKTLNGMPPSLCGR